ncbi:hypothetical protein D0Z07_0336 [Hyphodiscus hymeniophilus]|uniref:Uncharacterized protein n=1 Tax=Hyphodiscus hymeniophilus TaxID=353542 RepID=A0A9P6VRT2_9HELO|nr:hypothetical protein D0Z07_0336 [Hyphodiscus hymeniophilus]
MRVAGRKNQQHYRVSLNIPALSEADDQLVEELEDEEEDISPLEYARKNGLSRNYLQEPYLGFNLDVYGDRQVGLADDSQLPRFDLTANITTNERLTISKDAAILLASVSHEETSEWVDNTVLQMIDTRNCKKLKLELPLLRTDNETDCKTFARRKGFEIELKDVRFPLEMVEEVNNGGLGFSASMWTKGDEILKTLRREKLEVTRETLVYLQKSLLNDWTDEDEKKMRETVPTYKRNTALEPVTPPLSPLTSPARPYEPSMSDPVFDLPLLSDPESLTKQDLEAIEGEIFKIDMPTPIRNAKDSNESSDTLVGDETVKIADIYSPAASLDGPLISPKSDITRIKRHNFKVEEPLTPARPTELPKAVRFDDLTMKWHLPADSPKESFESTFFEEAFGEFHEKATRISEQESLIAADTTARVDVAVMDFSLPMPPWKNIHYTSNSIWQEVMVKNTMQYGLSKWPLNGKAPTRWSPFPRDFAKAIIEDGITEDDSTWQAFIRGAEDNDVTDTSTLTWKPPGLKILRDEDDDEEIEPANFEQRAAQDLSYLAKKRKMLIEERDKECNTSDSSAQNSTIQPPRKKTPKPNDFGSVANVQSHRLDGGRALLMDGVFSVANSVDNFLKLRGTKQAKSSESSDLTKAIVETQITPSKAQQQPALFMPLPVRNSPIPKTAALLPAPPNNVADTLVNVIVSSTLLKHRALIKHVETLAAKLVLVERDFSAHDTTAWMPGSVARSPITSPLASEADIIISPLVGVIITTLQMIKQKPLPGQKAKVAIRERLEKVSVRHEKIIVLVTEGQADENTRTLDNSDCIAFSEFVAFAMTLPSTVSVQFVGGGEATLAKWVISSISAHKVNIELLAEETHWELFLRRAGLNAFAAQAIIREIPACGGLDLSNSSKIAHFGLAAFVEMDREQRIAMFGPICGTRLMERVSAVVDARWS